MEWGSAILGMKNKGGVKICRIQGGPFCLRGGGLNFPGGFEFRRRKSPLLALDITNFLNFSPAARVPILPLLVNSLKKFTYIRLFPFSDNNMVK